MVFLNWEADSESGRNVVEMWDGSLVITMTNHSVCVDGPARS